MVEFTDADGVLQTFDLDNLGEHFYHADCMELLKALPDKCFDLAVVDPPYGIGMSGGRIGGNVLATTKDYKRFSGNDEAAPSPEYFNELKRVCKNQVIFGANHFIDSLPAPRDSSCWIVWDKDNGSNNFADAELAWTNEGGAVRMFRFRWAGMLQGNMKDKEYRIHPTQKPVALYRWIFDKFAERGMKILDTHVGSASSLIAAHDAGLQFVGCELDSYYYDLAKKRLDEHTAQMSIFDLGVERSAE